MRLALTGKDSNDKTDPKVSRWASLPGLCCQAAGGKAEWADNVTLAWLLFYAAADLMDSVQDQDEPDDWWREQGPGAALATASGLYFSASLALDQLHRRDETSQAAADVITAFYNTHLIMTSGQYRDLTLGGTDLETYWQLAGAKSGAFFRLACRSGARLASSEAHILDAFGDYGFHFGELIQIKDDLDDVRQLHGIVQPDQKAKIRGALPFVYALSVSPPEDQARLKNCLENSDASQQAVTDLVTLLDQLGAALYVRAEMENKRSLALRALDLATALQPHQSTLATLIQNL